MPGDSSSCPLYSVCVCFWCVCMLCFIQVCTSQRVRTHTTNLLLLFIASAVMEAQPPNPAHLPSNPQPMTVNWFPQASSPLFSCACDAVSTLRKISVCWVFFFASAAIVVCDYHCAAFTLMDSAARKNVTCRENSQLFCFLLKNN